MQNRLKNENTDNPDLWKAVGHLQRAIAAGGVDPKLLALVHLRASQINSCSACVYAGVAGGKKAGRCGGSHRRDLGRGQRPFH